MFQLDSNIKDVYAEVNGERFKLNCVNSIDITPINEPTEYEKTLYNISHTCSFTINLDTSSKGFKRLRRTLLYGTNNWRKMHGKPLHRYRW